MRKVYSLFLALCFAVASNAQTSSANYTFSTNSDGSLGFDKNSNALDMSTGTTTLLAASTDDTRSVLTNIGFEFWFMGSRNTTFSCTDNGIIQLDGNTVATNTYLISANTTLKLLAPLTNDMRVGTDGKIHYKLFGTAPNRVLVVEYSNLMIQYLNPAIAGGATFQARLYESDGTIEYVYGALATNTATMVPVNAGFGTNTTANTFITVDAAHISNTSGAFAAFTPAASSTITHLHSTSEGSRRYYRFTPSAAAAPTALNFTGVTATGMTLNWTDNSTDEAGFAIYRSTDGTNYTYISTAAANAVSSAQSSLTPSTTYYWKVYAVREILSADASGSQATNPLGNIVSTGAGGVWSATGTWVGGVVPTANDNVTIADGATVSVDVTTAVCYNLTVGQGSSGVLDYIPGTASVLTAGNNITITAGGTLQTPATGTVTTHILSLAGNLVNNGVLDLSTNGNTAGATLTFTGSNNSSFTGTGSANDLYILSMAKAARAQEVELNVSNFTVRGLNTAATGALLTSNTGTGTLKISGTNTFDGNLWSTAAYSIPLSLGFWLNNPNFTVNGQNGSPIVAGLFRISQGTYNIGTGTGNSMGFGTGSVIIVEGGAVNATGRFGVSASTNVITYTQTGGTITVCTIGNASSTLGSFDLGASSLSSVNVTGGTIICQLNASAIDYRMQAGLGYLSLTGGTLQLGNSASGAAKTFVMRGVTPLNTVITNTSAGHTLSIPTTAPATYNYLVQNLTINTGTTFIHNYAGIALYAGNVVNNGTFTATAASSRVYNFATGAATSWTGAGTFTTPMNSFEIDNVLGVTLNTTNQIPTNRIILFSGAFTNTNKITLGNGGTTTGIIQIGNTTTPTNAGVFDAAPVFNLGTGGQTISYLRTTTSRSTGLEVNPTRILTTLTVDDNDATHTLTLDGGNLTISTGTAPTLNLTNGKVNLNGSSIILGLNSTTAALAGVLGATVNGYMYNGTFKRWISATTGNRDFPMGIPTFKRNASINYTTAPGTGGSLTAEWVASPGGTNGLPLTEGAINVIQTSGEGYWRIAAADGLTGGNYTGTFTANGLFSVYDVTQLVLLKRADASSPWVQDGTHVTGSGTPAVPVVSRTGMSGFSDFIFASNDLNPLPVTLLTFSGYKTGSSNLLKWTTVSEQNSRGFDVQRSADGISFSTIGYIASRAIGGNSNDALHYTFTDNNPGTGKQYYRLRQTDLDNHSKLSQVILIKGEKPVTLVVDGLYPNPANTQVNVIVGAPARDKVSLVITDVAGRIVLQKIVNIEAGSNTIPVDINGLGNGNYFVKLVCSHGDCAAATGRFIKQ